MRRQNRNLTGDAAAAAADAAEADSGADEGGGDDDLFGSGDDSDQNTDPAVNPNLANSVGDSGDVVGGAGDGGAGDAFADELDDDALCEATERVLASHHPVTNLANSDGGAVPALSLPAPRGGCSRSLRISELFGSDAGSDENHDLAVNPNQTVTDQFGDEEDED